VNGAVGSRGERVGQRVRVALTSRLSPDRRAALGAALRAVVIQGWHRQRPACRGRSCIRADWKTVSKLESAISRPALPRSRMVSPVAGLTASKVTCWIVCVSLPPLSKKVVNELEDSFLDEAARLVDNK
jgi:hypothetical protein